MWVDQRSSLTAAAEERSESDALIFWAYLLPVTVKLDEPRGEKRRGGELSSVQFSSVQFKSLHAS
jgi:hypothetical protein